jgi:divalent metal cation (Fe/Co/Zn/Cd) transporter
MSSLTTLFSKMVDPERHRRVLNSCMSKTLRHRSKGIRTNSHQNFIFMKLKLVVNQTVSPTLRLSHSVVKLVKLS